MVQLVQCRFDGAVNPGCIVLFLSSAKTVDCQSIYQSKMIQFHRALRGKGRCQNFQNVKSSEGGAASRVSSRPSDRVGVPNNHCQPYAAKRITPVGETNEGNGRVWWRPLAKKL